MAACFETILAMFSQSSEVNNLFQCNQSSAVIKCLISLDIAGDEIAQWNDDSIALFIVRSQYIKVRITF